MGLWDVLIEDHCLSFFLWKFNVLSTKDVASFE